MINPYYYLYYKIYKLTYRTNHNIIEWSSMLTVSTLAYFNTVSIIILTIPKKNIIQFGPQIFIRGVFLSIFINYYIFINRRRYIVIVKSFENESRNQKIFGTIFALAYIFFSAWIFVYLIKTK